MSGELVGINSAIATLGGDSGQSQSGSIGLGFAIPVDQAKRIADELIKSGTASHASLGVQVGTDKAVDGAIRACFSNTGQLCISIERIYVPSALWDRFTTRFAAATKKMKLSGALDYSADMGSLISEKQLTTVSRHVDDAVDCLRGVVGVHRGEHEVTGLGGGERGAERCHRVLETGLRQRNDIHIAFDEDQRRLGIDQRPCARQAI